MTGQGWPIYGCSPMPEPALATSGTADPQLPAPRPNILVIMADQFAAHALNSSASSGGTHAHFSTPHLDRLRDRSTNFTRAYTSFPLCVPARSSMITGRYPHQLGIEGNSGQKPLQEPGQHEHSLGHWFASHGYDCAYAGKWHARQSSASPREGFTVLHPFGDEGLVSSCANWFAQRPREKPFLLVASFDDPHTICEYARQQPLPYGDVPPCPERSAPPLPANFQPGPFAAQAPQEERMRAATMYGTTSYTPGDWRQYRHAYSYLVSRLDDYAGRLLQSLDEAGVADNTVIIFTSDHGDGDAAHGWNQKTTLIEECIRVPFLVHRPGVAPSHVDRPVAAALNLLPTLCSVAGFPGPPGTDGKDIFTELEAATPPPVVVETAFDSGPAPITTGRSLITGRYKYTVYSWGKWREQLVDLGADPGELRNLAVEGEFDHVLERMRAQLLRWCLSTSDRRFMKRLVLPQDIAADVRRDIFTPPF